MGEVKLYCDCGWSGQPHIKHSYEKPDNGSPFEDHILHTESRHCKSCLHEIESSQNFITKSKLPPEVKQDLGIKSIPLPHEFTTSKYELNIWEDSFSIYSLDITDAFRIKHNCRSKNRVECIGEVFYQIVLQPIISILPNDSFNVEYKISDSEIDAFCEYFLEHFTSANIRRKPRFPQMPASPNPTPFPLPSIPNFPKWNPPAYPAPSPNQLPWFDPNKAPFTPWIPSGPTVPRKIDPYADVTEKYREIIKKIEANKREEEAKGLKQPDQDGWSINISTIKTSIADELEDYLKNVDGKPKNK